MRFQALFVGVFYLICIRVQDFSIRFGISLKESSPSHASPVFLFELWAITWGAWLASENRLWDCLIMIITGRWCHLIMIRSPRELQLIGHRPTLIALLVWSVSEGILSKWVGLYNFGMELSLSEEEPDEAYCLSAPLLRFCRGFSMCFRLYFLELFWLSCCNWLVCVACPLFCLWYVFVSPFHCCISVVD